MNARIVAIATAALLTVAACGGGDDDAAGSPAPATTGTVAPSPETTDATDPPVDGTTPTIPSDLPEALLPGVGPLALVGDALPELPDGDDPAVGSAAPVIVAETLDGEPVRIDASVDGPTWLVFLAHWCPHCNDEIPVINELRDDGRIPDDVTVIGVSTAASPDRPNWPPIEWLADKDWTFDAILDGVDIDAGAFVAANGFGLTAFPFSVLIDGDGNVAARWAGGRSVDELATLLTNSFALTS